MMKIKRMKIKFFDIEVYDEYKVCNELTSELWQRALQMKEHLKFLEIISFLGTETETSKRPWQV